MAAHRPGPYHDPVTAAAPRPGSEDGTRMEIRDWLRTLGDRVRLLVIIPLAAALIALLIGVIAPTSYRSVATVPLACAGSDGGPITLVCTQQAADFSAAVESEAVREDVSRETGVPLGDLGTVEVRRSGQSSIIAVTYTGTDEAKARAAAESFSQHAFRLLGLADLDAAEAKVEAANTLMDTAERALQEAEAEAGLVYSEELVGNYAARYSAWLDELNAAETEAERQRAQLKVDQVGAKLALAQGLELLNSRRAAALTVLIGASSDVAKARGALIAAEQPIATTEPRAQSKPQAVAQQVIFAAVFGFVLAVGLLVLLVLLQSGRNLMGSVGHQDDDKPAEFPRRSAAGRN